jgi:predicted GTPase
MSLDAFFSSANKKHYVEQDTEEVRELYDKVQRMSENEQTAWLHQLRERKPTKVEMVVRRKIWFVLRQRRLAGLRATAARAIAKVPFNPIVNTTSFNTASGASSPKQKRGFGSR